MKNPILFIIGTLTLFAASCTTEPTAFINADKTEVEVDEQITFSNTSEDAESYLWEFGDGTTSTEKAPVKAYTAAGSYTVRMTAYSKNEKKEDQASVAVTVIEKEEEENDNGEKTNEDYEGTYDGQYGGVVDEPGTLVINKGESKKEIVILIETNNLNFEVDATISKNTITIPEQEASYLFFSGNITGTGSLNGDDLSIDCDIVLDSQPDNVLNVTFNGTRKN